MAEGTVPMTHSEYADRLRQAQESVALRYLTPGRLAALDPLKPSRADYRLIHKLLDSSYSGDVLHTMEGYDLILRVFQRAKGSWERLFLGSSKDLGLLKKIIRVAFKKGHLPKAPKWK